MPLVATRGAASAQGFGEFGAVTAVNYIEDVFSTYLYTGTGATQTITNGIDLAGKGGLVWIKKRDGSQNHCVQDTQQGINKFAPTNATSAFSTSSTRVTATSSSGFSIGNDSEVNESSFTYASWTFREQAKFFDVVTWTGTGATGLISHNHSLGSTPGMIIWKRTSAASDWYVYHRSLGVTQAMFLNTTAAATTGLSSPNGWAVDSSTFSIETSQLGGNVAGSTYVAYLFAHDAGGFGLTGTDNVISCGSFTSDSAGSVSVNIGYEPQWVLYKTTAVADNWRMFDVMRGMPVDTSGSTSALRLQPNTADAEQSGNFYPTSTGFASTTGLGASQPYIYIAIRRGPMKVPTSGTSVFSPVATSTNMSAGNTFNFGFPSDLFYGRGRSTANGNSLTPRLTTKTSFTESTSAELSTQYFGFSSSQNIVNVVSTFDNDVDSYIYWGFRRAPGFFDVVAYTGDGTTGRQVPHNLGVKPELVIYKFRNDSGNWGVFMNFDYELYLNTTNSLQGPGFSGNHGDPTSTYLVAQGNSNTNTRTIITYLFATCPGVSKVGSYTGTGTTKQIDCGFTGGARFVLIKRTDSTGDWYVWDSARGIVSGNDPYLLLNSSAAEVTSTDYVDTYSAGFEISSTAPAAINANGGTFIFLAIA